MSGSLGAGTQPQLVLGFGAPALLLQTPLADQLAKYYPKAQIVACSTAGEILGERVSDDSLVTMALHFESTKVQLAKVQIGQVANSHAAGAQLMAELVDKGGNLVAVLVLSDGGLVNGDELVEGLKSLVPPGVSISGGLAADADRFERTIVSHNGQMAEGLIVCIGLYGEHLQVGNGSFGGWEAFGPERTITKAQQNHLFEIDGKPALDLYKSYLGPYSSELPGSALLFPLALKMPGQNELQVRTILNINEADGSMKFAGNVQEGSTMRLMKANYSNLVSAAGTASENALANIMAAHADMNGPSALPPQVALLVSCVGRKLVLKHRVEEEVSAAKAYLPSSTATIGFYSYGEISPQAGYSSCSLLNQTMTITTLAEA